MTKRYYEPTQVTFLPEEGDIVDGDDFLHGIAFYDVIICGCCGGIFEIEECKIYSELKWTSLDKAISEDN